MKDKMTVITAVTFVTMLVVTGFISSASARNLPRFIDVQKQNDVPSSPIRLKPIVFDLAVDHRDDPLHSDPAGEMRNPYPVNRLNNRRRENVEDAIGALDFHELQGGAGTATTVGGIRIDRQGQTANGAQNIQAQVNNESGRSTVATVLIPNRYLGNNLNNYNRAQIIRRVRDALLRSFRAYLQGAPTNYRLDGHLSN